MSPAAIRPLTAGWRGQARRSQLLRAPAPISSPPSPTASSAPRHRACRPRQPYFLGTRMAAGIKLFGKQATESVSVLRTTPMVRISRWHADHRANQRAGALLDLPAERHARPEHDRRRGVAAIQQAAGRRTAARLGGRDTIPTRARQQKDPTAASMRSLRQDLAGLGGDVRFLAHLRRRALLSRDQ